MPHRQRWTLLDGVGFVLRLGTAVVLGLTLYLSAQELGRRAAIALPGQSFEVAVPTLIFGTLIVLLIFPLFGGWKGGLREFAVMTALSLLAIALAHATGVLTLDAHSLPLRVLSAAGGLRVPLGH